MFHWKDAFFIAERLDAIQNSLPIPLHLEKEFHDKDVYIIWTKLSASSPGGLASVKVSLTPDQIKILNTVAILAIPAPGVGKAIQVVSGSGRLVFGTVAYTSSSIVISGNGIPATQADINFFLDSIASNNKSFIIQSLANNILENTDMYLQATADSLVGDSPVDIYILYRVISL